MTATRDRISTALRGTHRKLARIDPRNDGQLLAWDQIIPDLEKDPFMKKVLDSQRAWVQRVVYYELMNAPDYALAYNHYFPGKLKL